MKRIILVLIAIMAVLASGCGIVDALQDSDDDEAVPDAGSSDNDTAPDAGGADDVDSGPQNNEDNGCDDASPPNACGGCSELNAQLGEACAGGGVWECDGEESLKCVGGDDVPEIYVAPAQLSFQAAPTGLAEDRVHIRNIGSSSLTIEDIALTEGEEDYSISFFDQLDANSGLPPYGDDTQEAPSVLEPDSDFYIRIRFTPEDADASFGNLRIESDDSFQQIVDVELLGNSDAPCLDVVDSSDGIIDFGVGSTNTTNYHTVALRNCSPQQQLELHEIGITDSDDGAFSIDDDDLPGDLPADSKVLGPLEVATVMVGFNPQEANEDYEGALFIESTDGTEPERYVSLTGAGVDSDCPVAEVAGAVGVATPDNPVIATNQDIVALTAENSYDPGGDSLTYEWSVVDRPDGSMAEVTPADVEQPQFTVDIVGDFVIELKVFDESGISNCDPAFIEVNATPMEDVHIQLVWESPSVEAAGGVDSMLNRGTDLDIYYVRPGGAWGDPNNSVYWEEPVQSWDDGTVSLDIDSRWGENPENINHTNPEIGLHEVGVHFFRDYCWGPVNATVRVYFGTTLVQESDGELQQTDNFWYVGNIDWQGDPQSSSFNSLDHYTESHSLTSHWDIQSPGDC